MRARTPSVDSKVFAFPWINTPRGLSGIHARRAQVIRVHTTHKNFTIIVCSGAAVRAAHRTSDFIFALGFLFGSPAPLQIHRVDDGGDGSYHSGAEGFLLCCRFCGWVAGGGGLWQRKVGNRPGLNVRKSASCCSQNVDLIRAVKRRASQMRLGALTEIIECELLQHNIHNMYICGIK